MSNEEKTEVKNEVKICGVFKKVLFEKKDNNFKISSCKIISQHGNGIPISVNKYGNISVLSNNFDYELDKYYELTLEHIQKSRYPDSYNLLELKESDFWKLNYIVKFLQGTNFPGIGEIKSRKIVEKYGFDTLKIISSGKVSALDLGISEDSYNIAIKYLNSNPQIIEDQLFFLKLNLSPGFYEKINKHFSNLAEFIEKYKNNFYNYYFTDSGQINIKDLQKLTKHFYPEGHYFDKSILLYIALEEYFFNLGHTKVTNNDFYKYYYSKYEKLSINEFKEALKNLIVEERVLLFDNKTYLTTFKIREMEEYVVSRLYDIKKSEQKKFDKFEDKNLHKLQNEAINLALNSSLSLITGSPGTGKTLITNKIIKTLLSYFKLEDIAVVTPTGRATININKDSEIRATTIHSFLQWNVEEDTFEVNEYWPEDVKCLIIDEFSMVSIDLFYYLLKGINQKTLKKIIVVGDKNQLPAIGPGYLINDFIEYDIFDYIELTKIYRQAENYEIIKDAIDINLGKVPEFKGKNSQFIETEKDKLADEIIFEINKLLKKDFTKKDIAILSPIYNYQTGIDYLNDKLSLFWRTKENTETIFIGKKKWAINDKVINLVNDPSKKVFNGEIGYIKEFIYDANKNLTNINIEFENNEKVISYNKSDFIQKIMLAYCTSVHKYQGSESPIVLTVLFEEAKKLLSKKLIYTAITRAQKFSVIYGQHSALSIGIQNDNDSNRMTCIGELWNVINKK